MAYPWMILVLLDAQFAGDSDFDTLKVHKVRKLKQARKGIKYSIISTIFLIVDLFWSLKNYLGPLQTQYTYLYIDIVNESSINCPWGSGQQWHHCQRKWHRLSTLITNNLHLSQVYHVIDRYFNVAQNYPGRIFDLESVDSISRDDPDMPYM